MKFLILILLLMIYGCNCDIYDAKAKKNQNYSTKNDELTDKFVKRIQILMKSNDLENIYIEVKEIQQDYAEAKISDKKQWNELLEKADKNVLDDTNKAANLGYKVFKEDLLSDKKDENALKKYKVYKNTDQPYFTASRLFMDDDKINIENLKALYEQDILQEVLTDAAGVFKAKLSEDDDNELLKLVSSEWVNASAKEVYKKLYNFYVIKALPVTETNLENFWQSNKDIVTKENVLFLCLANDNMRKRAADIIKTKEDYKYSVSMLKYFYQNLTKNNISNADDKEKYKKNFAEFYSLITKNFIDNYDNYTSSDKKWIMVYLHDEKLLVIMDIKDNYPFKEALSKNDMDLMKNILQNEIIIEFIKDNIGKEDKTDLIHELINNSNFSDQEKDELNKLIKAIIDAKTP